MHGAVAVPTTPNLGGKFIIWRTDINLYNLYQPPVWAGCISDLSEDCDTDVSIVKSKVYRHAVPSGHEGYGQYRLG